MLLRKLLTCRNVIHKYQSLDVNAEGACGENIEWWKEYICIRMYRLFQLTFTYKQK